MRQRSGTVPTGHKLEVHYHGMAPQFELTSTRGRRRRGDLHASLRRRPEPLHPPGPPRRRPRLALRHAPYSGPVSCTWPALCAVPPRRCRGRPRVFRWPPATTRVAHAPAGPVNRPSRTGSWSPTWRTTTSSDASHPSLGW